MLMARPAVLHSPSFYGLMAQLAVSPMAVAM
jgi:hypothetical protein